MITWNGANLIMKNKITDVVPKECTLKDFLTPFGEGTYLTVIAANSRHIYSGTRSDFPPKLIQYGARPVEWYRPEVRAEKLIKNEETGKLEQTYFTKLLICVGADKVSDILGGKINYEEEI